MKEIYLKYNQKFLRPYLVLLSLVISVFTFSGFNEMIHTTFHDSDKTELLESKIKQQVYKIKDGKNFSVEFSQCHLLANVKFYSPHAAYNFQRSISTSLKAMLLKNMTQTNSSISLPVKIDLASSLDIDPLPSLG